MEIFEEEFEELSNSPARVKTLSANWKVDGDLNAAEVAAWYRVAEILLNLDEMITRT